MKLYRAVDAIDGEVSAFLVYDDNKVSVAGWDLSDEEEISLAKELADKYLKDSSSRFDDAINPVLIAEW